MADITTDEGRCLHCGRRIFREHDGRWNLFWREYAQTRDCDARGDGANLSTLPHVPRETTTYLNAAIERHEQHGVRLDTYQFDLEQIGVRLTGAVAWAHRFNRVQIAIDYVRSNKWPDNRRTDSYSGYERQAYVRELTREV